MRLLSRVSQKIVATKWRIYKGKISSPQDILCKSNRFFNLVPRLFSRPSCTRWIKFSFLQRVREGREKSLGTRLSVLMEKIQNGRFTLINFFVIVSAELEPLKALQNEAIFSCNLQRNGVSSCLLQEKLPPVTLLVCKIIRLQVIQQLAYVYNSTGACNIFFIQICVTSCKKKLPRVTAPLEVIKQV